MDRNESLSLLNDLIIQIEQVDDASSKLQAAKDQLYECSSKTLSALDDFDNIEKIKYIKSRVGIAPEKPKGAIKLAIPLYLSKLKAYKKEYDKYLECYMNAEKEYYEEFKDIREKIDSEEKATLEYETQLARDAFQVASNKYDCAVQKLQKNDLISEKLKDIAIIQKLIDYFHDYRADNIKEAVNLYYEEEHRIRLEEYAKEQVRLTYEANEQARMAIEIANEAAENVEEILQKINEAMEKAEEAYNRADSASNNVEDALYKINEAMRKAEEAYDRADQAYNEAQNAYSAATPIDI